jgi:hypothetical protein
MTQPRHDTRAETAEMLAAVGVVVTDEGKADARAKLRATQERMTPEAWEQLQLRYTRRVA